MDGKLSFREKFTDNSMTWPSVRITIQVPPWHWKIRPMFYHDDIGGHSFDLSWLFGELQIAWNDKPFLWE